MIIHKKGKMSLRQWQDFKNENKREKWKLDSDTEKIMIMMEKKKIRENEWMEDFRTNEIR
jgi:hypothetical protein